MDWTNTVFTQIYVSGDCGCIPIVSRWLALLRLSAPDPRPRSRWSSSASTPGTPTPDALPADTSTPLPHGTPYSSLVPRSASASSAVSTASSASDRGSVHSVNSHSSARPSSPGHRAPRARRSKAPSPPRASSYTRTVAPLSRKPHGEVDHAAALAHQGQEPGDQGPHGRVRAL
jgi:hypothetical protein